MKHRFMYECSNCGREGDSGYDFTYVGDGEYLCVDDCMPPFEGVVFDDGSTVDSTGARSQGDTTRQAAVFHLDNGWFLQVEVTRDGVRMTTSKDLTVQSQVDETPEYWCGLVGGISARRGS